MVKNFLWQREKTVKIKINGNQYNEDIEIPAHLLLSPAQGRRPGSKEEARIVENKLETTKFAKSGVLSGLEWSMLWLYGPFSMLNIITAWCLTRAWVHLDAPPPSCAPAEVESEGEASEFSQ